MRPLLQGGRGGGGGSHMGSSRSSVTFRWPLLWGGGEGEISHSWRCMCELGSSRSKSTEGAGRRGVGGVQVCVEGQQVGEEAVDHLF